MIKWIPAVVFGHGCRNMNKHKAEGREPGEAGIVAWTYMELFAGWVHSE